MGKCSSQIQDEMQYKSDIEESTTRSETQLTRTFDYSHLDYSDQHDAYIITDYSTYPKYPKHVQIHDIDDTQTDNVINNIISCSGKADSSYNSNGLANNQAANNQCSNGHNDSNDSPNDKNHKKPNKGNNPNKNGKPYNAPNENEKKQPLCPIPQHVELAKTVKNLKGDVKKLQQQYKNLNDKYHHLKSQREELCYNDEDEKRGELDKEETRCPIEKKQQSVNEIDEFMEQEFSKIVILRTNSTTNNINNLGVSIKKKKKKFINKKNKRSFSITRRNTKGLNPNDNQIILPTHNSQTVKCDKVSTKKSKMLPTEDNRHCNKYFIKKILAKKAKEKFDNPDEYMKQFEKLHSNQFIKWYCNDTIGIINYNIHCQETGKPLYVVYTLPATWKKQYNKNTDSTLKTNSTKFTQIDCYTEYELKQLCPEIKSELLTKPLPTISIQHIQKSLIPQINVKRSIEDLLRDTERRGQLFKNTPWTRLHVEPIKSIEIGETIYNIDHERFVSIVNAYIQELTYIQLIPIIPSNSKQIEYALVVPLSTFHVAIAFSVNNANTTELKQQDMDEKELYNDEDKIMVSAIYLSIYDAHQLVQAHHQKQECKILETFQYSVNYLQIGTNKKKEMHTMKQLQDNYKNLKHEQIQSNRKLEDQIKKLNELIRQQKQQTQYFQQMMIENQKVLNFNEILISINSNQMIVNTTQ